MQLSLDVIDGFRRAGHDIVSILNQVVIPINHFVIASNPLMPNYEMHKDELYLPYGEGSISFSKIQPTKIISIEIDEPIKLREDVKSVVLDTWNNAGSSPLNEVEKWSQETTTTEENDIASSIEAGMSAKVGAEYAGFKAEIEAHLNAKLGLDHKTGQQSRTLHEHEQDIEIPPWKRVSLVQKHSICDFKQTIRTTCQLGATIKIDGGWKKTFSSLKEFQLYMLGGGGVAVGNAPELDAFVQQRKFTYWDIPDLNFTVEKERLYNDVETGEVNRTEVDAR